jgi:hypothetical protein
MNRTGHGHRGSLSDLDACLAKRRSDLGVGEVTALKSSASFASAQAKQSTKFSLAGYPLAFPRVTPAAIQTRVFAGNVIIRTGTPATTRNTSCPCVTWGQSPHCRGYISAVRSPGRFHTQYLFVFNALREFRSGKTGLASDVQNLWRDDNFA